MHPSGANECLVAALLSIGLRPLVGIGFAMMVARAVATPRQFASNGGR